MADRTPHPKLSALAAATRHAFKGLQDWVEVFYAGTHVDSQGRKATFSVQDLDEMVANVTGSGVPAVIGHPTHEDPAYAWGTLKREGEVVLAKFADINPDFQAAVDSGAYRERSVKVYRDPDRGWVMQHIGWLGAVPPALTGLKPLAYSTPAGAEAHEFAASDMDAGWALGDVARLMRGLREFLIDEYGLETADKALPDWTVTSVADAGRRIADAALQANAAGLNPLFNRGEPTMTTFTQAQLDEAVERARREAAEQEARKFASQGAELSELRAQRQAERIGVQITGWKQAGVLLPAEEPGLAEFMAALEGGEAGEFAFSAADKSQVKQTPAQWFAAFMAARKPLVKLGVARTGDDPEPVGGAASDREIADRASAYQREQADKGVHISIGAAIDAVTQGKDKA